MTKHVTRITLEDAEHYSPQQREAIVSSYPEHERDARIKGLRRANQDDSGASIRMRELLAGLVTQGGRSPTGVTSSATARSTGDRAVW
jgi:hypothetical protein